MRCSRSSARRPNVLYNVHVRTIRGVGNWGEGKGDMSPPKFPRWNIFSLNSTEFVTFNQIFSMFFGFLWTLLPYPIRGYPTGDGTPRSSPTKQIPRYAPWSLAAAVRIITLSVQLYTQMQPKNGQRETCRGIGNFTKLPMLRLKKLPQFKLLSSGWGAQKKPTKCCRLLKHAWITTVRAD